MVCFDAVDDNGNLTGDGANTYSYDDANRLVGIVGTSLTASYTYNGLGDRVSQVKNGITTSFVLDLAGGLTQVLQDGDYTYLYGNERIGQITPGTAEYFLGDALGSVRQLIDGDGFVGVVKRYEPYGELVSSVGESSSAFGFTGEWASRVDLLALEKTTVDNPVIVSGCRDMSGFWRYSCLASM